MSLSLRMVDLHATSEAHIEEVDKSSIILPLVTCKTRYIIHRSQMQMYVCCMLLVHQDRSKVL
jgi:hypothetical protein